MTITSGKGGVGKSNLAVNLAVSLRKAGKRVIIFDADFGLANVEVMFGVIPKYTLADVIYENQTIKSIISNGPLGIDFISAGSSVVGLNNLNHKQIHFIVSAINITIATKTPTIPTKASILTLPFKGSKTFTFIQIIKL